MTIRYDAEGRKIKIPDEEFVGVEATARSNFTWPHAIALIAICVLILGVCAIGAWVWVNV